MQELSTIPAPRVAARPRRMLLTGNILVALAWCALNIATGRIAAADEPPVSPDALQAPLLDESHARAAFHCVQAWVDAAGTEVQTPAQTAADQRVSGLAAVRVTLRHLGMTVGTGDAAAPAPGHGEPVPLLPLLKHATARALEQTDRTLRDARVKAAMAGLPTDESLETAEQLLQRVGPQLQVDVQLAHRLEPIAGGRHGSASLVLRHYAPGFHGLMFQRRQFGNHAAAWVWPATSIALNLPPKSQLNVALSDLGFPGASIAADKVMLDGDLRAQRFEVIHVVRPSLAQPMTELVRGNTVLPTISMDARSLETMARRLADHLLSRMRDDGSFTGTLHPSSDRFDPDTAAPAEAALAVLALGRYGSLPDAPAEYGQAYGKGAAWVRSRLLPAGQTDAATAGAASAAAAADPGAAALLILALADRPLTSMPAQAVRNPLAAGLLALHRGEGTFGSPADPTAALNVPTQALVTAALARVYEQTRDPNTEATVSRSLAAMWQLPDESLISALPWLAMAELTMQRLDRSRSVEPMLQLRRLAQQLRARQVKPARYTGPNDVVGGLNLLGTDVIPMPDWRSAQMLVFLARVLREPDLAHGQNPVTWLLDCGLAARFLGQLMVDEPGTYYMRSPQSALGGVRMALWDNRLGVGPTAMTLLAVLELQKAMHDLEDAVGR